MEENKAQRLDLSKLKALELPHQDVEVEIAGEKQLVTVHALGGRGQLALDGLPARANHEQLVQTALIYGADMDGEDVRSVNLDGAAVLVIGSEGDGMSRIVREKCDFIISLKMKGQINSLNASVAGGILMYEFAYKR